MVRQRYRQRHRKFVRKTDIDIYRLADRFIDC